MHACIYLKIGYQFFNLNLRHSFLFGGRDPELDIISIGYLDPSLRLGYTNMKYQRKSEPQLVITAPSPHAIRIAHDTNGSDYIRSIDNFL